MGSNPDLRHGGSVRQQLMTDCQRILSLERKKKKHLKHKLPVSYSCVRVCSRFPPVKKVFLFVLVLGGFRHDISELSADFLPTAFRVGSFELRSAACVPAPAGAYGIGRRGRL